jgi:hypothetical protein
MSRQNPAPAAKSWRCVSSLANPPKPENATAKIANALIGGVRSGSDVGFIMAS